MKKFELGEMERRFADLMWKHEPVKTRKLVELCAQAFEWKRTTTYTMLKRLCERGLFSNENGTVVSIMSKDDFLAGKGESFIDETFEGSLPKFLTAFTRKKKLSEQDIEEIQRLIDDHREEE